MYIQTCFLYNKILVNGVEAAVLDWTEEDPIVKLDNKDDITWQVSVKLPIIFFDHLFNFSYVPIPYGVIRYALIFLKININFRQAMS